MANKNKPKISETLFKNRITGSGNEDPNKLIPNPKNFRKHPKNQNSALSGVLREIGWIQQVIVNTTTGNIVDGHLRVELAKENKESTIPVIYVQLSPDEEALALATLDPIAAMAETDKAKLTELLNSIESQDEQINAFLKDVAAREGVIIGDLDEPADADPHIDRAEELNQKWQVAYGDLWQVGEHRLLCGDSTKAEDVARVMGGEKAELLFTSPPYADMREYNGGDLSVDNLVKFIPAFRDFANYQVINLGIQRKDGEVVQYWDNYIKEAKDFGYKLVSWNVWNREGAGFSIANITSMFATQHEWIFVFGKDAKKLNLTVPNKEAGNTRKTIANRQKDGTVKEKPAPIIRNHRQIGTINTIMPQLARNENISHPAMFPPELPALYIEAMTDEAGFVADPFLGSGTTMVACQNLNRKCRGIEISPAYCAVILERMKEAFPNISYSKLEL
ncbi:MAG: DNA methyltransferase [Deltaproteobacteria bacterium]